MRFPDRVYGIENEFALMLKKPGGGFIGAGGIAIKFRFRPIDDCILSRSPQERWWFPNGSCVYIDTGEHPEYASAECRSIKDLVAHAKAGEILMAHAFLPDKELNSPSIEVYKNNIGFAIDLGGDVSFGCHENYFAINTRTMTEGSLFTPFLLTRQIIDGAGWWLENGIYAISQRALHMTSEIGGGTMANRSILNDRGLTDKTIRRFHLLHGDANILEFPIYLKFGTTALVAALIENEARMPFDKCINPVIAMHEIAVSGDIFSPVAIMDTNEMLSAFEIQVRYLETVKKHLLVDAEFDSEKTEAELKHICSLWECTLNALYARDIAWMLGRLDYVTKQYFADRFMMKSSIHDAQEKQRLIKDMDIMYHHVSNRTLQNRMNEKWADRRIVNDADIMRACVEPPQDTRAKMRGDFITALRVLGQTEVAHVDWMDVKRMNAGLLHIKTEDPLVWRTDEFDNFLKDMRPSNSLFMYD